MMAKDPKQRYATAELASRALKDPDAPEEEPKKGCAAALLSFFVPGL